MWKMPISGPYAHQLARINFSRHIAIQIEEGREESEIYALISPHMNHLKYPEDNATARYKMDALLLILNTSMILCGFKYPLRGDTVLCTFKSGAIQTTQRNQDPFLQMEQLEDPYVEDVKYYPESSNRMGKIINLTHDEELVREVIVLYGLCLNDPLYLLINAYKICENIEFDLNQLREKPDIDAEKIELLVEALKPTRNKGVIAIFQITVQPQGYNPAMALIQQNSRR